MQPEENALATEESHKKWSSELIPEIGHVGGKPEDEAFLLKFFSHTEHVE